MSEPAGHWLLTRRVRLTAYAVVLTGLGTVTCFYRLDAGMLVGDEACFAYTTDRMLSTGNYIVPYIDGRDIPHLNAAPLQNWLTCLTASCFEEGNLRYRFWGAVFGVGCGLAALALGSVLFGPEVGYLAGWLLLTNFAFLFLHGARWCVMESGVAFFVTLMLVCYARTAEPGRPGLWWALVGLNLGLAVLMKPPAMGGFIFLTLVAHHLLTRRDLTLRARLVGPLQAGVVAALVALPWYAAVTVQVGPRALDSLFLSNAFRRAADRGGSHPESFAYYLNWLNFSSTGLKWAARGMAWGVVCVAVGWHRRSWGIVVLPAGLFVLVLSSAATKHFYYSFTVYPVLAVAAAGVLLAGLSPPVTPSRPCVRWGMRALAAAGMIVAGGSLATDVRRIGKEFDRPVWPYPPLVLHRATEHDLAAGRAKLILYQFPDGLSETVPSLGQTPSDSFYLPRIPHAVRVRTAAELNAALADGVPAVVVLPPRVTPEQVGRPDGRRTPDRTLLVQSAFLTPPVLLPYPVLLFHDAERALGLGAVLHEIEVPRTSAGSP